MIPIDYIRKEPALTLPIELANQAKYDLLLFWKLDRFLLFHNGQLGREFRKQSPCLSRLFSQTGSFYNELVCFNRLGKIRDQSYENQRYRASGLTLVTAAIVLWNTVYLDRAITAIKEHGQQVDDNLLQYLSPFGWEPKLDW